MMTKTRKKEIIKIFQKSISEGQSLEQDEDAWFEWGKQFAVDLCEARDAGLITEEERSELFDTYLGDRFGGTVGCGSEVSLAYMKW
jgi:hypothetical protein